MEALTRSLVIGGEAEPESVVASFADRVRRLDPLVDPLFPTALLRARGRRSRPC